MNFKYFKDTLQTAIDLITLYRVSVNLSSYRFDLRLKVFDNVAQRWQLLNADHDSLKIVLSVPAKIWQRRQVKSLINPSGNATLLGHWDIRTKYARH